MSIIPNDHLKPSTSLDMRIFEINDSVPNPGPYISDFFAKHGGFWKSCVIRNLQNSSACTYRMSTTKEFKTLPPKSERPIQGWGSYLEIITTQTPPEIKIDYIGVLLRNALQ